MPNTSIKFCSIDVATILVVQVLCCVIALQLPLQEANASGQEPGKKPKLLEASFPKGEATEAQSMWAKYLGLEVNSENSIGLKLVLIPPGKFEMGSPESEKFHGGDELQHTVTISRPYLLGVTEIGQRQWKDVMGTEPWNGEVYVKSGDEFPATNVSWDDVVEFCQKLSEKEGKKYRLPTEAEWEYACRCGSEAAFSFGEDESKLLEFAWYDKNASEVDGMYAHQVGKKLPNAFGLFDMQGNAEEWCQDWYSSRYYENSPSVDPSGPANDSPKGFIGGRVLRGGSWGGSSILCRSANRASSGPGYRVGDRGFRVVCELKIAMTLNGERK